MLKHCRNCISLQIKTCPISNEVKGFNKAVLGSGLFYENSYGDNKATATVIEVLGALGKHCNSFAEGEEWIK